MRSPRLIAIKVGPCRPPRPWAWETRARAHTHPTPPPRTVRCCGWQVRDPVGVVASIVPFNFPFMVPMWTTPIALGAPGRIEPAAALALSAASPGSVDLTAALALSAASALLACADAPRCPLCPSLLTRAPPNVRARAPGQSRGIA